MHTVAALIQRKWTFFMTFINRDANFWTTHKKGLHIFEAFTKPWCALMQRSYKGGVFFMTFRNRDASFWAAHKNGMQVFEAFIKPWCAFLKRWYKGCAFFIGLDNKNKNKNKNKEQPPKNKIGRQCPKNKINMKMNAASRNYELDSCIHGSRPTMNCSFNEFAENAGSARPPSRKCRNAAGFLHPHVENWRTSQALCTFLAPQSRKLREV